MRIETFHNPRNNSTIVTLEVYDWEIVEHKSPLSSVSRNTNISVGLDIIQDTVLDVLSAPWLGSEEEL